MGMENPLLLMGGISISIVVFTAQKSSEDSQKFNAFPSGDESSA